MGWMARKIDRFEDLIAWQKARLLSKAIFDSGTTGPLAKEFALRDQTRRAARSVMANIAEGFERSGSKEFHKGLSVAMGSCAEVRSDLYTMLDTGLFTQVQFDHLYALATETSRITNALRAAVRKKIESPDNPH
jgi:four helix bundle protein